MNPTGSAHQALPAVGLRGLSPAGYPRRRWAAQCPVCKENKKVCMFADAYEKVSVFTHPIVVSVRHFDGTVRCSLGAFLILNPSGWAITVAHLLEVVPAFRQHSKEIAEYKKQVAAIEQDDQLSIKQKRRKIRCIKSNSKWITNYSLWWGRDGVRSQKVIILPEADLAVARLEPFDPKAVPEYPVLKNPSTLRCGTSLCRLGYPFHNIEATYHEETNSFELAPGSLPVPRFPIEGIYTRNVVVGKSRDGKREIKFLETSSPGLRGQSGGPIFDTNGTVWAIQSKTTHFPLGFSPKVKKNGREVEENQFLNVGWGVHPEVIVGFLRDNKIEFRLSDY